MLFKSQKLDSATLINNMPKDLFPINSVHGTAHAYGGRKCNARESPLAARVRVLHIIYVLA